MISDCFRIEFAVKKEGWGGGGSRLIVFSRGATDLPQLKPSGKSLNVSIGAGLPKDSSEYIKSQVLNRLT